MSNEPHGPARCAYELHKIAIDLVSVSHRLDELYAHAPEELCEWIVNTPGLASLDKGVARACANKANEYEKVSA
jgi:hypothetical protein